MRRWKKGLAFLLCAALMVSCAGGFGAAEDTAPTPELGLAGDADGDGTASASDALAILQHATLKTPLATAVDRFNMDMNGDGSISAADALLALQMSTGIVEPEDYACRHITVECEAIPLTHLQYAQMYDRLTGVTVANSAEDIFALSATSFMHNFYSMQKWEQVYHDAYFEDHQLLLFIGAFSTYTPITRMDLALRGSNACLTVLERGPAPDGVNPNDRGRFLTLVSIPRSLGVQSALYNEAPPNPEDISYPYLCSGFSYEGAACYSTTQRWQYADEDRPARQQQLLVTDTDGLYQLLQLLEMSAPAGEMSGLEAFSHLLTPRMSDEYFSQFCTLYCYLYRVPGIEYSLRPQQIQKQADGNWHVTLGFGRNGPIDESWRYMPGGTVVVAIDIPRDVLGNDPVMVEPFFITIPM